VSTCRERYSGTDDSRIQCWRYADPAEESARWLVAREPRRRDVEGARVKWRDECVEETLTRTTKKGEVNDGKALELDIFGRVASTAHCSWP
jgi:hypothetical protein